MQRKAVLLIQKGRCRGTHGDSNEFLFWKCRFFLTPQHWFLGMSRTYHSTFSPETQRRFPSNFRLRLIVVIRSTLYKTSFIHKKEINSVLVFDIQCMCHSAFARHCITLYIQAVKGWLREVMGRKVRNTILNLSLPFCKINSFFLYKQFHFRTKPQECEPVMKIYNSIWRWIFGDKSMPRNNI